MAAQFDWGLDQPANPAARPGEGVQDIEPGQLPEVRVLSAEGWQLAPDAPVLAFLPAVWPPELRTWVPDRSTRHEQRFEQHPVNLAIYSTATVSATPAAREEAEADIDELLAAAGAPGRPRGRLWLLKPPQGYGSVELVVDELAGAPKPQASAVSAARPMCAWRPS
jgi:hypothetical protein